VRGSTVSANQQVRNCKQVSIGQTAFSVARRRAFGPLLRTRRFSSFPDVSARFSSLLGRYASDLRRTPAWAAAGLQSRSNSGRNVSETATTTYSRSPKSLALRSIPQWHATEAQSNLHERNRKNIEQAGPKDTQAVDTRHPNACAGHSCEGHSRKYPLSERSLRTFQRFCH